VAPAQAEQIVVGDTAISGSLYGYCWKKRRSSSIRCGAITRRSGIRPQARPSEEMVRAAHTLTGIHRTAGFPPVADTAHALESALLTLQHHSHRHESMLPVLADAARALADLVDFVGMRQHFGYPALQRAERGSRTARRSAGDERRIDCRQRDAGGAGGARRRSSCNRGTRGDRRRNNCRAHARAGGGSADRSARRSSGARKSRPRWSRHVLCGSACGWKRRLRCSPQNRQRRRSE
jgi:HPt (histidine-containing phosphotransfer) domain-containing protein